jgi:hypothetical protein
MQMVAVLGGGGVGVGEGVSVGSGVGVPVGEAALKEAATAVSSGTAVLLSSPPPSADPSSRHPLMPITANAINMLTNTYRLITIRFYSPGFSIR